MSISEDSARDDLDFLKSIVRDENPSLATAGKVYGFAGLCYGFQCLANFADIMTGLTTPEPLRLAYNFLPTVVFLIANFVIVRRQGHAGFGTGVIGRAIGAGFGGAGIANVILAVLFGLVAYRLQNHTVWLLFPCVVCALQGAVWFVIFIVKKLRWMGLVAAGWFASTIALGLLIEKVEWYVLVLGIAMIMLMYLPGRIMTASGKAG